jgi:hypothetical protein
MKVGVILTPCRRGEIGRRRGLKILRGQLHVGSIPTAGTNKKIGYVADLFAF